MVDIEELYCDMGHTGDSSSRVFARLSKTENYSGGGFELVQGGGGVQHEWRFSVGVAQRCG